MGRRNLFLVGLVCVLPVVASYFAFYVWKPVRFTNYGELLQVRPLPDITLHAPDGAALAVSDLRGKWVLLAVDSGQCDAACQAKLFRMRQLRLMQGKEMDRVERVWLVTDGRSPDPELLRLHQGARPLDVRAEDLRALLPDQERPGDFIYLIDPLGNLMMRYPRDADPQGMKKDLERLLKVSRVG